MRREVLSVTDRAAIYYKTAGYCNVCGDPLLLDDYGSAWVVDHVRPLQAHGLNSLTNYLPACVECNALRWSHKPDSIRRILLLGVIANSEAYHKHTNAGLGIRAMYAKRLGANWLRRRRKDAGVKGKEALQAEAKKLIERFVELDELVMARQEKTKKWWSGALKSVLADKKTPRRLKAAYSTLRKK